MKEIDVISYIIVYYFIGVFNVGNNTIESDSSDWEPVGKCKGAIYFGLSLILNLSLSRHNDMIK